MLALQSLNARGEAEEILRIVALEAEINTDGFAEKAARQSGKHFQSKDAVLTALQGSDEALVLGDIFGFVHDFHIEKLSLELGFGDFFQNKRGRPVLAS